MSGKPIEPFDPLSEKFQTDPWGEFRRMREHCRVYRHEGTLMPVVSFFRNTDLNDMRRDWETWSSSRSAASNKKGLGAGAVMIGMDPPQHSFYRKIVAPLFMPGKVGVLQPEIDKHVNRILDRTIDAGEIDFLEDVAAALATAMIGTICGIPESDWPFIRKWTVEASRDYGKGPFFKEERPDIEARVQNVHANLGPYIAGHIKTLRKSNTPSILLEVADKIDDDISLMGLCTLIIGAGNDTTSNLIVNGLWELMQAPKQMAWLRENPDKINQAVEEFLRCRGSLRRSERVASKDIVIDGVQINKDDIVMIWNASASRDPELVPDRPDEFDITRKPVRHMGFGGGIHMCIGNILARMETRTLYRNLLERTSRIEETRGDASYESWGNGLLDIMKRYSVSLHS